MILFIGLGVSLLVSSCSTILDIILRSNQCIYPDCTEQATDGSAYCSRHKPYYFNVSSK